MAPIQLPDGYMPHEAAPCGAAYLRLREVSGLTPRSAQAAERGLPNSFFAVHISYGTDIVAMGRIVGDGALFLHIVDVAVDPEHQGRGLGKSIVGALLAHIENIAPAEIYVSLMANGEAYRLYEQFGFSSVMPEARGMALWAGKRS
jgi:ribosomal protein S18 acetylase RimI-like enzyme